MIKIIFYKIFKFLFINFFFVLLTEIVNNKYINLIYEILLIIYIFFVHFIKYNSY